MERWTRFVLRHRAWTLGVWGIVLVAGVVANLGLSKLLSNEFPVPGTDSERARAILKQDFGQRDDGTSLFVFKVRNTNDAPVPKTLEAKLRVAAAVVPAATNLAVAFLPGVHAVTEEPITALAETRAA